MGGIVEAIFGGGGSSPAPAPAMPEIKETPAMPMMDDQKIADAKRKKAAAIRSRSGRQSTILSGDSGDSLGG